MPDPRYAAIRVEPGSTLRLEDHPTDARLGLPDKAAARGAAKAAAERLAHVASLLPATGSRALLVVLQGMDGSGKDGTVRAVFGGLSPSLVRVADFKAPSSSELAHDYLWRVHSQVPEKGRVGVFNRSHYEDVLVVRVEGLVPEERWRARYEHINAWERMLVDEGVVILKLWLRISREEQGRRLRARLDDPAKNWKFEAGDIDKRRKWDAYEEAYREAVERTSTPWAPWYVVPADAKRVRDAVVSELVADTVEGLGLRWPELDPDVKAALAID